MLKPVIKKLAERNLSNKAILNWGVQNDIIPSNPFAGVKKRRKLNRLPALNVRARPKKLDPNSK